MMRPELIVFYSLAAAVLLYTDVAGARRLDVLPQDTQLQTFTLQRVEVIQLPNGTRPEGLCAAADGFYVSGLGGSLLYIDRNRTTVVATEHMMLLTGVKYDASAHKAYVAASISGKAFIYTFEKGSFTKVLERQTLMLSPGGAINDVAIGANRVYFSDSIKPFIYSIPRLNGAAEKVEIASHHLGLNFIGVPLVPVLEAANGLVEVKPGVLAVANYKEGQLYLVDTNHVQDTDQPIVNTQPEGALGRQQGKKQATPRVVRLQLPWKVDGKKLWPDGLIVDPTSNSTLYLADNFNNRLLKVHLDDYGGNATAEVQCVLKSSAFNTPTTLAVQSGKLWTVNAHFLDCMFFLPCTWQQYEIVGMQLDDLCLL